MEDFIKIMITKEGEIRTEVFFKSQHNIELAGIALASASRTTSMALAKRYEGTTEQADQILARLRDVFNADLVKGDLGETKTFSILKDSL